MTHELLQIHSITSNEIDAISQPVEGRTIDTHSRDILPEVRFLEPSERKDKGALEYTTVPETVLAWTQDPTGEKKMAFLSYAFGIDPQEREAVLQEAGMGEFMQAKKEGRFIGMVSTQVLKPTPYYLENARMLAELSKKGIPTTLMVLEYPQDRFTQVNADKKNAFGKIEFPVGFEEKVQSDGTITKQVKTVKVDIRPTGIREDDGSITRISSINEANGKRCDQILIQIVDAKGPDNQDYTETLAEEKTEEEIFDKTGRRTGSKVHTTKTTKAHYEAALGMDIPGLVSQRTTIDGEQVYYDGIDPEALSMTDFYRILWKQTISHMRDIGELPSEEDMPMIFVDMHRLYTTLAKHADPPAEVLQKLGFDGGFPLNQDGMMKSESYYLAQVDVWDDMYIECSSCGGDAFVGALQRTQQVRQEFGLPETEVRNPDVEVPELEAHVMHPTGRFMAARPEKSPEEQEISQQIRAVQAEQLPKAEMKARIASLNVALKAKQQEQVALFKQKVKERTPEAMQQSGYIELPIVTAVHKKLAEGIDDVIKTPQVQETIASIKTV